MMRILTIIFFSSWKFAATFPIAVLVMKMSFKETFIFTNIGGITGVLIFSFFAKFIIMLWDTYWPEKLKLRRKTKKVFTKKNRRIVKIKTRYGFPGIVILNPVLLSIPVGSFLMVKYYGIRTRNFLWLIGGQIVWSLFYTWIYFQFKPLL